MVLHCSKVCSWEKLIWPYVVHCKCESSKSVIISNFLKMDLDIQQTRQFLKFYCGTLRCFKECEAQA